MECDKIIQNVLNLENTEEDGCDKSVNGDQGVRQEEVETMLLVYCFEMQ